MNKPECPSFKDCGDAIEGLRKISAILRAENLAAREIIEKLEGALRTCVGFEPMHGLEPRKASETLAAVAEMKKRGGL